MTLLSSALTGGTAWLRPLLLLAGVLLVAFSATFLLALQGNGGAAKPGAAANSSPPGSFVSAGDGAGLGSAFGSVDGDQLAQGLLRLYYDLHPTPTPTNTPRPTPTPKAATPTPVPQPVAQPTATGPSYPPPPPPPSNPNPPAPPPSGCPTAGMNGYAQALFNATNSERTQRGLPALAASGCVTYVAQIRSDDMAANNYFAHSSPSGDTAFTLMDHYGVPYGWAGENLARNNYPDNQSVGIAIRDLMASSGHRANILNTNYTKMGIGYREDGSGMKYFTMIFTGPA
ncbi:MAG: CAP domain-containing protein [Dehalococcoidia bacterium]